MATGISLEGERQVLGVSVSLSEHETHWKAFLKSLRDRGMHGVAEDFRIVVYTSDRDTADTYLKKLMEKFTDITPKMVE